MPVGDCENAFLEAASREGIELTRYKQPWLNQRGHFGLPDEAEAAFGPLDEIFTALGGDSAIQSSKRTTALPGDFIHLGTGTMIEVDELQHFTSFRLRTFDHYPTQHRVDFDINEYLVLCLRFSPTADKYRQAKAASGFGPGGRQRQRAYYDALRDLTRPHMGHPPMMRVPAPKGDGKAAFEGSRARILKALS